MIPNINETYQIRHRRIFSVPPPMGLERASFRSCDTINAHELLVSVCWQSDYNISK